MKSIQIQLTSKCNQRCFMCRKYTWKSREINYNVLIDKIRKYKDCTFTFSGGDPLEYSKLKKLTDYLIKNNISYQVFTNMNYELNDDQRYFLDNAKIIQVSLDGLTLATYVSVRRPLKCQMQIIHNNIEEYKNKIKINVTVSNRNYFEVRQLYELYKGKIRFFPVHTDESAKLEPWMLQHIKLQFLGELPEELKLLERPREEYKGKCYVKNEHRIIDELGREYPCCRAINDNGEDWDGQYCISNLKEIENENVLYDFCSQCDRYRKFNENWENYKNKEKVYL